MKAGRELDALVLREVFGGVVPPSLTHLERPDNPYPPSFSTDLGAAMVVFEWLGLLRDSEKLPDGSMKFYKPVVRLEWYEHDEIASVTIGRCKGIGYATDVYSGQWPTIPQAICFAALKAVGVTL